MFLNFRFFEAYKQTDILSYCSDWFCRKLSLKSREGMDKKYYFYDFICQFDRSLFKTRDPESKHKTFIVKTFISLLYRSNLLKAYRGTVVSLWNPVSPESERKKIIKQPLRLIKQNLKNKWSQIYNRYGSYFGRNNPLLIFALFRYFFFRWKVMFRLLFWPEMLERRESIRCL